MEIDDLAIRVGALGEEVSGAAARLARSDPGPAAFAGDGAGRLGELGRALHARCGAALAAREREAAAAGAWLTDLAGALRTTAGRYRDVEDETRRRHQDSAGA
jgi:Excreted virulence factor EspC, type VII ESX diderm